MKNTLAYSVGASLAEIKSFIKLAHCSHKGPSNMWRHDIHHNDNRHDDTQPNGLNYDIQQNIFTVLYSCAVCCTVIMLSVIMLNVFLINVIMKIVIMKIVILKIVILKIVILLSGLRLSIIILRVIMVNVTLLSVAVLRVAAPNTR